MLWSAKMFVAQLDDDLIHKEVSPDAKVWWHDAASFYVVCRRCLNIRVQ